MPHAALLQYPYAILTVFYGITESVFQRLGALADRPKFEEETFCVVAMTHEPQLRRFLLNEPRLVRGSCAPFSITSLIKCLHVPPDSAAVVAMSQVRSCLLRHMEWGLTLQLHTSLPLHTWA